MTHFLCSQENATALIQKKTLFQLINHLVFGLSAIRASFLNEFMNPAKCEILDLSIDYNDHRVRVKSGPVFC